CAERRRCRAAAAPDKGASGRGSEAALALRWSWPEVLVVVPLAHGPRMRRHGRVQRWAGKGNTARPKGPPCAAGGGRNPPRRNSKGSFVRLFPRPIGGDGSRRCQVNSKIQANSRVDGGRGVDFRRIGDHTRPLRL